MLLGHIFCKLCLCYWTLRDYLFPPKEKSILFVAHPDDDTLFFHSFIKEHKPYIVLCTAGWSLRRLPCFFKAMKYYGVKYRAYGMGTRDKRIKLLERHVRAAFKIGKFDLCATHNAEGEYGHEMHQRVHNAVINNSTVPIMVPVSSESLKKHPLNKDIVKEKIKIFRYIYTTETWVLDQYTDWVCNEKLEQIIV